jgi:hypothetical protein
MAASIENRKLLASWQWRKKKKWRNRRQLAAGVAAIRQLNGGAVNINMSAISRG